MSRAALPVPRLVPRGVDELERRARALAAGAEAAAGPGRAALPVVTFRLAGAACAVVTAVVERAVPRLAAVLPVPLAAGGERAVAFVEDRPLPVLDLAGLAAGAPRAAAALTGQPALVLPAGGDAAVVVVEGPLELAEEALAASSVEDAGDGGRVRLAGSLAGGAHLLDAGWLLEWAGRSIRS